MTWTEREPCHRCGVALWRKHPGPQLCAACRAIPSLNMPTWTQYAACTRTHFDAEWWWPERTDPDDNAKLAMTICRSCKVRDLCLDYAIQHKEAHGIWGGLLPAQRNSIAQQRRRRVV